MSDPEASLKRLEEWIPPPGATMSKALLIGDIGVLIESYRAQAALLEGEQEAYARGFNAGFEDSAEQLSALQSDNDTLRAALEQVLPYAKHDIEHTQYFHDAKGTVRAAAEALSTTRGRG